MNQIQRLLGYGIPSAIFQEKLSNLKESDREKLEKVVSRLWVTLKLRYESNFFRSSYSFQGDADGEDLQMNYLPNIELYLLCTCLDTLAGKDKGHKDFDAWIKEKHDENSNLPVSEVISLYQLYRDEYGIGSNLRKLFKNLPSPAQIWLSQNVKFQKHEQEIAQEELNLEEFLVALQKYFFNIWRNAFTHSSLIRNILTEDLLGSLKFIDPEEWILVLPSGVKVGKGGKLDLYRKAKVDLSFILRFITHISCLQILGVEVTENIIEKVVRNLHRIHTFYFLLYELRKNHEMLLAWNRMEDNDLAWCVNFGVSELITNEVQKSIELFDLIPQEIQIKQKIDGYFQLISNINLVLLEFKKNVPPCPNSLPRTEQKYEIQQFIDSIRSSPDYFALIEYPQTLYRDLYKLIHRPKESSIL
jgi:hypothetical protein